MKVLFAKSALLPEGWTEDCRITLDGGGRIGSVEAGQAKRAGDHDLGDRILLPAPGNVHSHSFQRAMAGLTETRGSGGRDSFWTWRRLMYRFLETLDPDAIEAIAAQVYMEMLEAGYASVGEFHYLHHRPGGAPYVDAAETSARIMTAAERTGIGLTHLPVFYHQGGIGGEPLTGGQLRFGCDLDGFLDLVEQARAALGALPDDARMGIAVHSLRAVPPPLLHGALEASGKGPVHIHIAEQEREVEEIEAAYGARPVDWLMDTVDVNERWCLVHGTHVTSGEIERVARCGAVIGLCPITEANLGDGIFEAAAYLRAGGRIGIGSDSNIRISLAEELRILEYSQRLRDRARAVLCREGLSTGRTLFEAVCRGGAQALGREAGAIAPGLLADLVAVDPNRVHFAQAPGDALLDSWIFAGDDRVVRDVWSAGRHMVRNGRHVRHDEIASRLAGVGKPPYDS